MINLYPPSAYNNFRGIKPPHSPDVDTACQEIYKACKGLGTDEKTLTVVLGPKTAEQRYLIAMRYKELYAKDLKDLVKSETGGQYGKLLHLLAQPLPEAEAFLLRQASKGAGTDEKSIIPILVGRTNAEINILKKTFFDVTGKDLAVTMNSELGGDFKKVIMASLQEALVDFNPSVHTQAKAEEDAVALYKAGQGKIGTDEATFIKILASSPPQHLQNINNEYAKKYNNTIVRAVDKEFGGDAKKALLFLTRMVVEPAEFLAEHFESTMKGFGTDEEALSSAVVRYQCVLPHIKAAYKKLYKKELRDRIHGETSGDYRALLLQLVDAPAM